MNCTVDAATAEERTIRGVDDSIDFLRGNVSFDDENSFKHGSRLPLFKNKKCRCNEQEKTDDIIPSQFFLKIHNGEDAEDNKRNNLLNSL
jgi:hypothetical protein